MKLLYRSILTVVVGILLQTTAFTQGTPAPELIVYPDMILHNGKIITADDSFTVTEALAIRDGKFLATGDSGRILQMKGPQTQAIDLQGKTVVPGLIDTHFHLHNYAFNRYNNGGIDIFPAILLADMEGTQTKDSFLRAIRRKGQQTPPRDGWIVFTDARGEDHGVIENTLLPSLTQRDLDEAFPGTPAAFGASHGNNYSSYIVNSAGMKIVLEKIPANARGLIKDRTGQFTGQLTGDAASLFGRGILPWPEMKLVIQSLEKVIPMYTAQGLTMIQTKTPGYVMAALRESWRRGQMPIRWRANIEVGPDTEVAFKFLGNLTDLGDPLFRITSGPGGVPSSFFDATYEKPKPVSGRASGRDDTERLDRTRQAREEELKGTTDAYLAAKYGWSMTNVHNNGDMSTDIYLDEIEKGLKDRVIESYGQRFGTDHSLMLSPKTPQGDQFERMKKLGIIPSMNAAYLLEPKPVGDDPSKASPLSQVEILSMQWGKERVFRMLPVKTLIQAGFKPTSESDRWYYPASYPFWIMEKLITRKDDKYGAVWGPQDRVTRQEALWMKTNWAAAYTGDEKELGTIEPGKWADLVILDKDYLTVPEDEISKIKPLMTLINGRVVYDASKGRVPLPGENLPSAAEAGGR